MIPPRNACGVSPQGAEARGSKPTCVGLDGPRSGRVSRLRGLQGTPASGPSPIRGVRLDGSRVMRSNANPYQALASALSTISRTPLERSALAATRSMANFAAER